MDESGRINQANWDEKAAAHAASPGYSVARFAAEPDFLSYVVQFDRPRLGELTGLDVLHLQCHIGTDTVSLARLGARVTGLDYSAASLEQARRIAELAGVAAQFVHAEVYEALDVLGRERFDVVYTGVGALCWLPDIARWAQVVAGLLRPGGRLFVREGHPMLWTLDEDRTDDLLVVQFPYFETPEPFVYDSDATYVPTDQSFEHTITHTWNHGLGELITALLDNGLVLSALTEHDSVPWEALPGKMIRDDVEEWRLVDRPDRVALTYTLQAEKPR